MAKVTARDSLALVELVRATRARSIVEFGSWQGRSALTFLTEATQSHPEATIVCVDTWLGSREHWSDTAGGGEWSFTNLEIVEGEPNFINTFRRVIEEHGFAPNVKVLRCPTAFSEFWLKENCPEPDLFYIDADHSTAAVIQDIAIAWRIATNGLVCGDDWTWEDRPLRFPSVRKGVLKSALRLGVDVFVAPDEVTWALKNPNRPELTGFLEHLGWRRVSRFSLCVRLCPNLRQNVLARQQALRLRVGRLTELARDGQLFPKLFAQISRKFRGAR